MEGEEERKEGERGARGGRKRREEEKEGGRKRRREGEEEGEGKGRRRGKRTERIGRRRGKVEGHPSDYNDTGNVIHSTILPDTADSRAPTNSMATPTSVW